MKLTILNESVNDILGMLPTRYKKAFSKAYTWPNKTSSYLWTPEESCEAVVKGIKPIAYGYNDKVKAVLADKYHLNNLHDCLFLDDNYDIADLVGYASSKFDIRSPIRHYLIGICCGYPINEVEKFANSYFNPGPELEAGFKNYDAKNIVK